MNMPVAGAIDIGGTKIAVGIVDAARPHPGAGRDARRRPELGYPAALARTGALLRRLLDECGLSIAGIGSRQHRADRSRDRRLRRSGHVAGMAAARRWPPIWSASSRCAVAVENDADAAALAEAAWGAGRGSRSLLYVTISTGIGAGIILDGKLYRGALRRAPGDRPSHCSTRAARPATAARTAAGSRWPADRRSRRWIHAAAAMRSARRRSASWRATATRSRVAAVHARGALPRARARQPGDHVLPTDHRSGRRHDAERRFATAPRFGSRPADLHAGAGREHVDRARRSWARNAAFWARLASGFTGQTCCEKEARP